MSKPITLAITGASGVCYGVELLRVLRDLKVMVHLVISRAGERNLTIETGYSVDQVKSMADRWYEPEDVGAPLASGSFLTQGMIVAPCTIRTLSAIANSYTSDLVARAADVTLKEGRPLVLMVRETPLHKGHLNLMARAADMGAVILPPVPAFYHQPSCIADIIRQSVGKALDQLRIKHDLFTRWGGDPARRD